MNYGLIEIYRLILVKGFQPEIIPSDRQNAYLLYLWSPNGKYFTQYELAPDGVTKWKSGVMPERILK